MIREYKTTFRDEHIVSDTVRVYIQVQREQDF